LIATALKLCLTGSAAKAPPGNVLSSYFKFQHAFVEINNNVEMV